MINIIIYWVLECEYIAIYCHIAPVSDTVLPRLSLQIIVAQMQFKEERIFVMFEHVWDSIYAFCPTNMFWGKAHWPLLVCINVSQLPLQSLESFQTFQPKIPHSRASSATRFSMTITSWSSSHSINDGGKMRLALKSIWSKFGKPKIIWILK